MALGDKHTIGAQKPSVFELFDTMDRPATRAIDGEGRREEFFRQMEALESELRVVLNVGLNLSLRFDDALRPLRSHQAISAAYIPSSTGDVDVAQYVWRAARENRREVCRACATVVGWEPNPA